MEKETNVIYRPKSKITKDKITIYGCGTFGEASLVLNKIEAALLYVELHKFLF
jgi:hypothetical protein